MKAPSPGMRTFVFGVFALVFLLVGLSLAVVRPSSPPALFEAFVWGIVGVFWGVVGKHSVETLSPGTGVAGALRALFAGEQKPAPTQVPPTASVAAPPGIQTRGTP